MAVSTNAGQSWRAPDGPLDRTAVKQLEQAVNYHKGLHGDAISHSLTIPDSGPGSRLLLQGSVRVPNGVTLRIQGVCRIL